MFDFVIGLIIFVCVMLVLVILAQNSKGGGLSSQFGGSGASQLIGVKKTGDLLERITWGLAILLLLLSLSTKMLIQEESSDGFTSPNIEEAQRQSAVPANADDGLLDALTPAEEPILEEIPSEESESE